MYVSFPNITIPVIITCTVVPTKSDSDVIFCLRCAKNKFSGREAKGLSKGRYDETFAGEDVV